MGQIVCNRHLVCGGGDGVTVESSQDPRNDGVSEASQLVRAASQASKPRPYRCCACLEALCKSGIRVLWHSDRSGFRVWFVCETRLGVVYVVDSCRGKETTVCECCCGCWSEWQEVGYRRGEKRSDWDIPRERNQMKKRRLGRDEQVRRWSILLKGPGKGPGWEWS